MVAEVIGNKLKPYPRIWFHQASRLFLLGRGNWQVLELMKIGGKEEERSTFQAGSCQGLGSTRIFFFQS